MTEGELSIRGSEEPTALAQPTTISGTNDSGALTAGTLLTPSISFTQHITNPAETDVHIDASFTQTTPGSVTGNIDEDGNVTLSARLRVDLAIAVEILPSQDYECTTSPVNLTLEGAHDGDSVVLADENFSVPATTVTASCPAFIADGINLQLQGPGHAISMAMDGALTRPIDPGEESTTTLAVSPEGPVDAGDEVVLTATVAPGPGAENTAVPAGFVTFLDGSTPLGLVPLDETGTAQLVTSDLLAGPRRLRARYEGSAPIYALSTSAAVAYQVIAAPLVVVDLPPGIQAGGTPVDFSVEATNTGFGTDITNARLDVTIGRASGSGAIGPLGVNPRITLSTLVGETATPVTLTASGAGTNQRLRGSIGGATGIPLPVGEVWDVALRLGATANTAIGPLRVTFTLVEVDGGGVITETLTEGSDVISMVAANRAETTITAGQEAIPEFELPEIPAVLPVRARAGNAITVFALRVGPTDATNPTGGVQFSIDGRVLLARSSDASSGEPWATQVPLASGAVLPDIMLPRDIGTGSKMLTIVYAGDLNYRPATASFPLIIEGAIAPSYECVATGTAPGRFLAQIEGSAALPPVARPGNINLGSLSVRLHLSRATRSLDAFREVPLDDEREITLALGPDGSGEADTLTETNGTVREAEDGSPIDHTVRLQSPTGHVVHEGAPGDITAVTLDTITMIYTESFLGARNTITCNPLGDPLSLGSIVVAGTTVEATPGVVGLGDDVVLRATSLPAAAGTVEFRDGGTTIGVVPTADGTATLTTSELPVGTAEIIAIFRAPALAPTTTSEPVEVRVVGTCAETVDVGNGAVVRLVYMELLGRCPDAAGYAYWVARLDGGTTPAAFARAIARTPEAVGRVVDDAYETMLGRSPDATGRAFWIGRLQGHGRYDQLLADLGASSEFWVKAGSTNAGFVARVYDRLLDRAPEQSGLDYWIGRLDAGTSRRALIVTLANLDEPLGVLVASSYGEILDRAPDASERADGIGHLRSTGDRSGLYAELIGRPEFSIRAQSFPGD